MKNTLRTDEMNSLDKFLFKKITQNNNLQFKKKNNIM